MRKKTWSFFCSNTCRYHQWNSKPEFVVATHRVLAIGDVINLLKKERDQQQTIAKASSDPENDDIAEKTTDDDDNTLNRKEDKKLIVYLQLNQSRFLLLQRVLFCRNENLSKDKLKMSSVFQPGFRGTRRFSANLFLGKAINSAF